MVLLAKGGEYDFGIAGAEHIFCMMEKAIGVRI